MNVSIEAQNMGKYILKYLFEYKFKYAESVGAAPSYSISTLFHSQLFSFYKQIDAL